MMDANRRRLRASRSCKTFTSTIVPSPTRITLMTRNIPFDYSVMSLNKMAQNAPRKGRAWVIEVPVGKTTAGKCIIGVVYYLMVAKCRVPRRRLKAHGCRISPHQLTQPASWIQSHPAPTHPNRKQSTA